MQKDGEEIARIDKNGRVHYQEKDSPDGQTRIPEVFLKRNENETVASLPCDEEYYVTLETIGKEKLSLKIVGALAKSMAPLL